MKVRELIENYVASLKDQGTSWYKIQSQTKHVLRHLGDLDVEVVNGQVLEAYRLSRRKEASNRNQPPEQSSVNRELGYLRAALRRAHRDGLIEKLPYFRMRRENGQRTDWWTPEQFTAVFEALRERHPCVADLVQMYYVTGWRKSDLLGLTWDEVRWERGVIILPPRRTKEKDSRILPIAGTVREILEHRRTDQRPGVPWVFHRDGEQRKDFRRAWDTARKRAGCWNLLHGFRRTFARRLLLAKVPIPVIMRLAGWKRPEMVERYARLEESDLREAMIANDPFRTGKEGGDDGPEVKDSSRRA